MPASYRIDPDAEIVYSYYHGCVTDADIVAHHDQLRVDPLFKPHFRQLGDFRGVTQVEVTVDMIRHLARIDPWGQGARRAGVANSSVVFGLLRMFELLTEQHPDEIQIFTDMDAARKWLGLD